MKNKFKLFNLFLLVLILGLLVSCGSTSSSNNGVPSVDPSVCDHHNITSADWKIEKEANCTEEGLKKVTCPDCGKTLQEVIPVEPGKHVFRMGKCKYCGIEKCNHKGKKWIVDKAPTCSNPGVESEVCDNPLCHEHYTDLSGEVHYHRTGNTQEIPATGIHKDENHDNRCDECGQQIAPED